MQYNSWAETQIGDKYYNKFSLRMRFIFDEPGTRWKYVPGRLRQLQAGPGNALWGVNRKGYIFYRSGINRRRPYGRRWVHVNGRLKHVTVGCRGVFGVSADGKIWSFRPGILLMSDVN